MKKHKKLIISTMIAAVMLFGSIVGVAFADDGSEGAGFHEKLAESLGITPEELQSKIADIRGDMPQRGVENRQSRRGPDGNMSNLFAELDEETQAALKNDLDQAREEMHDKTIEILESYEIDTEALHGEWAEDAGNRLPFRSGFMGPRGARGGIRGFGGPATAVE